MFLQRFKPSAIDPLYLVNRQVDLDWLVGAISTYLSDPDPRARGPLSFCVLGEKGVGKTILTKAALWKLRGQFSDRPSSSRRTAVASGPRSRSST
jgi:hypothetical protein